MIEITKTPSNYVMVVDGHYMGSIEASDHSYSAGSRSITLLDSNGHQMAVLYNTIIKE